MTLQRIVTYPAEVLRRPAEPVREFGEPLAALARDMFATMYAAAGVGLAAPQIDVGLRLFVMDPGVGSDQEPAALVNPVIVHRSGEVSSDEGCLSIPGYTAEIVRAAEIVLQAQNVEGGDVELSLQGFPAIIAQHEVDHLDGVLFVDYLGSTRWRLFERDFGRDPYRWRYASARR